MDKELLELLFPSGLLDYFSVVSLKKDKDEVVIYLEEKNLVPEGYNQGDIESKGFYNEESVQDFPLRGKSCSYKIRRRKWIVKSTGQIIYRDWNLVAKGTRITNEFATFLKELNRYYSNKL